MRHRGIARRCNMCALTSPKERRENRREAATDEIMAVNFPKLMGDISICKTSKQEIKKKSTSRQIKEKLLQP